MSGVRDRVLSEFAKHRVNYHQRNIGGETSSTLRYTSCDGCDWQGGWHDESGWEAHLTDALMPLIEEECREREAALERVRALLAGYEAWTGEDPFDEFASSPKQRGQLRAALGDRTDGGAR